MHKESRACSTRLGVRFSLAAALVALGACSGSPAIEGLGETAVRVRADRPFQNSATLQPEADQYCRQFGRIAEPAGPESAGNGKTWYRYNCLPE